MAVSSTTASPAIQALVATGGVQSQAVAELLVALSAAQQSQATQAAVVARLLRSLEGIGGQIDRVA